VADRAAITDAEVRKVYLKCVRVVHPDKQKQGGGVAQARVKAQAQAVFTALKDAYGVHANC
jgi:DnaJ-class molecular chaperone